MAKCRVCGRFDAMATCICGFCTDCIKKYGHDACEKEIKKNKEDK